MPVRMHIVRTMTKMHSPAQAAKIAGASRSKVSRALKDGKLRGQRNNSGHWLIAEDDLREWLGDPLHTVLAQAEPKSNAQIARLETEVSMLRERLVEIQADRDAWKHQASRRWWDFFVR